MAIKTWKSEELGVTIDIDHDICEGYGECVSVCPGEVYELVDGKATAPNIDECVECCACVDACPVNAITKRKDGIVLINEELCNGCKDCIEACPLEVMHTMAYYISKL